MSIWTIKPETETLHQTYVAKDGQSHQFWIKVKRHLTVGETRRVQTAGWRGVRQPTPGQGADGGGPEIQVDWRATSFARTEAYLVDWSLEDEPGKKIPVTREGIETLNPSVFAMIEDAITAHVEEMAQEKKASVGSSEPSTT